MIEFDWPWLAAALPLPWLMRWLIKPLPALEQAALRVPTVEDFTTSVEPSRHRYAVASRTRLCLAVFAWCSLTAAGMRPLWLGDLIDLPSSGRDLLMAIDLSESMAEEDFVLGGRTVDRLTATQSVAGEFIARRLGDRIGLILFGEHAYLQAPLTFDRQTVKTLLDEAVIGLAGRSTAIGDAIGLAVKRLREQREGERVVILMTDGANTAGALQPLDAADLAARDGLRIHTIGVGADEMLMRDFFGVHKVNPAADLDEKTLKAIADRTGGRYFRARDAKALEQIYTLLDQLEPVARDPQQFRPRIELYVWPLAAAVVFGTTLLWLRERYPIA
jgi:Ca-activated chloride channel family protein